METVQKSVSGALLHKSMYMHGFSSYICIFIPHIAVLSVYMYMWRKRTRDRKEGGKVESNFCSQNN